MFYSSSNIKSELRFTYTPPHVFLLKNLLIIQVANQVQAVEDKIQVAAAEAKASNTSLSSNASNSSTAAAAPTVQSGYVKCYIG